MRILIAISAMLLYGGSVRFAPQESAAAQSPPDFHEIRRIAGPEPKSIQAFDISPDGALLAVLSQSESTHNSLLRILVEDVGTGRTLMDLEYHTDTRSETPSSPWYVPHVKFSAYQRFVIVQDWEKIRVVNLSNLQVVRTFTSARGELTLPLSILGTSKNDLFLISYGTRAPFRGHSFNDLVNPRVQNELVDISTGQRQSSWESMDIPESLSDDGKFAAVSDWESNGSLLEIEIVDTQTGQKLRTLHSGYRFGKLWTREATGRVIGKFLSGDEILLSPDEHIDSTGHKSGGTLKLMRASDGWLVRET